MLSSLWNCVSRRWMRSEGLDAISLDPELLMEGAPETIAAEILSNLVIETATDGVSGSKEPETVPAEAEVSVAVVKKVSWKITAEDSAIDNGVAPIKEEEATAGEDPQKAEGVDGDAAVDENGNEAEGGDAEESSSDEEDNDEEESNADEDDYSQDGEDSPAEVHYKDEDVQDMLEEFYQLEQEAIEAQEKLEDESLKAMRLEVSSELSETKSGPELEAAVEEEMATYEEICKETLADLEDQIAILQEKLEDAGVDLPQLYKSLEKEVLDICTTEAWKKRTHWVGLTPPAEASEGVQNAELDLKMKRPVRRHHGRIQDEGASGFLKTKVKAIPQSDVPGDDWSLFDILDKEEDIPGPGSLMGTEKWASVYLADTPEQAARMGLALPGVDDVEEIGDMNSAYNSKLFKEALASEGLQGLTGKQKTNLKKVREEDDVKITKRLQRKQLPPRPRKPRAPSHKKLEGSTNVNGFEASSSGAGVEVEEPLEGSTSLTEEVKHLKIGGDAGLLEPVLGTIVKFDKKAHAENGNGFFDQANSGPWFVDSLGVVHPHLQNGVSLTSSRRPKRRLVPTEIDADAGDAKRRKTVVMIDSDGEHEVQELANETKLPDNGIHEKDALVDSPEVVVLGSRKDSSQRVELENQRSASWLLSSPLGGNKQTDDEPLKTPSGRKRNSSRFIQDSEPRNFDCTACGMPLKNREVMKHPSLDVGICKKCKNFLFSGPFNKDAEGHEDECRWCGQGGDVLCCDTCDKVFCSPCIKRNLGQEVLDQIADSEDWKCFFCNKQPLNELRLQFQAVKDALRAQQMNALDTEDDFGSDYRIPSNKKSRNRRRNIRRVLDDGELDEKTKHLLAVEKERQELLESWRAKAKANGKTYVKPNKYNRNTHITDQLLDMDEDDIADEGFILNKARSDDEEPVRICSHISRFLKPHQLAGMRFMWENCIESVSKVKSGVDGLGCILAHSMGLGKTLQVIGFVHTVLKKQDLGLRTVLIVVPVNVLHNWRSEFHKWQPGNESQIPVYMLEDVARADRVKLLAKWQRNGGVMLIGYTAFRNLSTGKTVKDKAVREKLTSTLQYPGPDIVVCDEAHMIKNPKADITQTLRQVRTHRRIALTGSPLQNNLQEYYCMVDFVREGFLGGLPEFRRRFVAPIENGQRADSTSRDVKLMKHRAHVLHKQLIGFVQRKTMSVLKDELPSKCVYVISVKLSPLQRALYLKFLEVHGFSKGATAKHDNRNMLFKAYHTLAKIWNHPDLLIMAQEEKELREDNVENFIVDRDDDVPEVVEKDGVIILNDDETVKETGPAEVKSNATQVVRRADEDVLDKSGWWKEMMEGQARQRLELSGKMVILMKILSLSSARADKALVFSQSLHTLDLIEYFLESMPCLNGYRGNWKKNRDWYRLDGQTSAKARQELVERFNDPENTCVQCVLISTRAGSLGINLPAANRVVIFDGSWNPTHDLQALFRAWRFGQTKNVYAYRLLASGTMEEKIYNRQVAKEGLAARVLDEHQVARHFFEDDLEFFYVLDEDDPEDPELEEPVVCTQNKESTPPDAENSQQNSSEATTTSSVPGQEEGGAPIPKPKRAAFSIPHDAPPRDDIMGKLLLEYRPKYIVRYHEHEPLLEDIEDEKLSKEEQTLAWESFQYEESAPQIMNNIPPSTPGVQLPHNAPSTAGGVGVVPQFQYFQPSAVPHPLPAPVQYNLHPHSYTHSQVSRYCNPEIHVRQLKAENVKPGTGTVCGLCNQIISWETIKRS